MKSQVEQGDVFDHDQFKGRAPLFVLDDILELSRLFLCQILSLSSSSMCHSLSVSGFRARLYSEMQLQAPPIWHRDSHEDSTERVSLMRENILNVTVFSCWKHLLNHAIRIAKYCSHHGVELEQVTSTARGAWTRCWRRFPLQSSMF